MSINELLKPSDILLPLRERGGRNWVPGYRDAEAVPGRALPARRVSGRTRIMANSTYDAGEYFLEVLRSALGLGLAAVKAVLEREQQLAHGV